MSNGFRDSKRPLVSIIVPARDEEASLGSCLASLAAQTGIAFEIIVVDDDSTDRTRQIAESVAGARVIAAPALPQGWTGKNNAVAAGEREAKGNWLLFTDADTVHLPGSLARAMDEAKQREVALLSYSPEQIVGSFWERAVMPVIFSDLASTYRPTDICNPASPVAAANGQYLLISREAYDAAGGHAAVAFDLLEDVALARLVKASGRKIFLRYGSDAVRTRMYRNFAQLREGWTKNLALLFPNTLSLAGLRLAEFVLIVSCVAAAVISEFYGHPFVAMNAAVMSFLLFGNFFTRIRRAHFPLQANLLSFLGLPLFAHLLLRSRSFHKNGKVRWKGRSYGTASAAAVNSKPAIPDATASAEVHP
jgi:glycosyltransferase involved in cell wall biosynthesis